MARALPRASAGNQRRIRRKGKNTYDPVYRRVDWRVQPATSTPDASTVLVLPESSRKNSTGQIQQKPKPQPKGGSVPAGTKRSAPTPVKRGK